MDRSELLTPREVAQMFRVDPKTVTRWGTSGKLRSIRTPGGHRRFLVIDVLALLEVDGVPRCYRCHRSDGEIVDRSEAFGDKRHMHAYGKCPS